MIHPRTLYCLCYEDAFHLDDANYVPDFDEERSILLNLLEVCFNDSSFPQSI